MRFKSNLRKELAKKYREQNADTRSLILTVMFAALVLVYFGGSALAFVLEN